MKRARRKIKGFTPKYKPPEPKGEQCQRCKLWGHDRRTLFHSCGYMMDLSNIPFEEVLVTGQISKKIGEKPLLDISPKCVVPIFEEPNEDKAPACFRFFNLLVCGDCRKDWLRMLEIWFKFLELKDHMPEETQPRVETKTAASDLTFKIINVGYIDE